MKTKIFLLLAIFMVSTSGFSQTRQEKRAIQKAEQESARLRRELSQNQRAIEKLSVIPDTAWLHSELGRLLALKAAGTGTLEENTNRDRQINILRNKLADLKREANLQTKLHTKELSTLWGRRAELIALLSELEFNRKTLVDNQISQAINQEIPQELSARELRRRERSYKAESGNIQIDREQLGLQKLKVMPVKADQFLGYLGMVIWSVPPDSDTTKVLTFVLKDVLGKVETKTITVKTGQLAETYLLPGEYFCQVFFGSTKLGERKFKVTPAMHDWNGVQYHWYNYFNQKVTTSGIVIN